MIVFNLYKSTNKKNRLDVQGGHIMNFCSSQWLNSDFCKYHFNSKKYNNKVLDDIRKINLNNIDINIRKITFELKKLSTQVILNQSIDQLKNKIKNNTDELNNEHCIFS